MKVNIQTLDPIAIRKIGLETLAKALGPVGMVRLLQQYEGGIGNYTKERQEWLRDSTVKGIVKEIKSRRKL
jgi:hypothetical protein